MAAARSRESVPTGGARDEGGATVLASWDDAACPVPQRRALARVAKVASRPGRKARTRLEPCEPVYQLTESDRQRNTKFHLLSQMYAARARDKVYPLGGLGSLRPVLVGRLFL